MILRQAIPDGHVEEVARRLHVSADTVRRRRREPESDDAPLSTGRLSPLDRVEDLIDAVFLSNPQGAHFIANRPTDHYEHLAERHARREMRPVNAKAADALREVVDAVNAISLDAPLPEIEREVEEAEAAIAELRRHYRVAYAQRGAA
jgi:hypothetical protein